jgi:hypothetical protein
MNASQNYTVGTKFTHHDLNGEQWGSICTIHQITETRVCYNDGKKHFGGATNRNVFGSWLGTKRFNEDVKQGYIKIIPTI